MAVNIINKYTDITRKQMNTYMKLVFGNLFNKEYNDIYIQKYINTRYYNYNEAEVKETLRARILSELKDAEETLAINNISDRDLIQKMDVFFQYVVYFDDIVKCKDLKKKIERVAKLRKRLLNKSSETFEKNLYDKMMEFKEQKAKMLESFDTDDFYLKLTNYPKRYNVYRVNLKHNVEIPLEYSEFAINKAFNSGIIQEDKLIVEYYLVEVKILNDILKQKFSKQYILEFSETILKKSKKLKNLLNIINSPITQDKMIIKIQYEDYLTHKEQIHDLLRDGYKFAVILDASFVVNSRNVQTLDIFKYVILNKQLELYEKIKELKIQNILEI